jgi:hypothetical protein
MCDECDDNRAPNLTRRALLALTASAVGGLTIGMWACRDESSTPRGSETKPTTSSRPSTAPAPDLGAEVFPDATGKAIAKPSDAPVIVLPRTDWTSTHPNLSDIRVMNGVQRITVHHTAWITNTDAWKPTAGELESIREFHSGTNPNDRKWADIAYHFVVDRAGRVWQARPLAYQGAHVRLHNEHNLGIVLLGNFDVQTPSAAQLIALTRFIGFVRQLYSVPVAEVYTHGELGKTSCPGKRLQAFMDRARKQWAAAEIAATAPAVMKSTAAAAIRRSK